MSTVVSMLSEDGSDAAGRRRKALADRLADPEVSDALLSLLDHADLLAVLVEGVDGMMRRGDDLSDTLVDALAEVRATAEADDSPFAGVDLADVSRTMRSLGALAKQAGPALDSLTESGVVSPDTVGAIGRLGGALTAADEAHRRGRTPTSMRRIIGELRDKDVRAGLGYLLTFAKELGASGDSPTGRGAR
ncbi:DUF1641 domain-containing protein [Gordonia sp. NPDC003424]